MIIITLEDVKSNLYAKELSGKASSNDEEASSSKLRAFKNGKKVNK